jgi:hypothetical protein
MATDLQSIDGVRSLKLVAAIGNAPIYSAFQADANLSQLSSQFEIYGLYGGFSSLFFSVEASHC